jgi:hypothetical protein
MLEVENQCVQHRRIVDRYVPLARRGVYRAAANRRYVQIVFECRRREHVHDLSLPKRRREPSYEKFLKSLEEDILVEQLRIKSEQETKFRQLADTWRRETRHVSSLTKIASHPAYQRIIGMGPAALPFILRELRQRDGHWLWALFAITGEDPSPEGANYTTAVRAWLDWGIRRGYLE